MMPVPLDAIAGALLYRAKDACGRDRLRTLSVV